MPSLCRLTVLVVWLAAGAAIAEGLDQVPWAPTLDDAQKLASEQRKLVLVHFYNDHCPPCERVEREVFTQPRVVEAIDRNYVPVKVHAGAQPKVAEQFRVDRWPTDIICTPAGLEIMRTNSPQKAEAYIGLMDQVAMQTGVGAGRQWQASMQAVGQQVLDPQVAQAQAVAGQAAGAAQGVLNQTATAGQVFANQTANTAQGYANQANSTFQAYAEQANRWNQQAGATAQQANSTAQQLGNTAQQLGTTAQQFGNTTQQLGTTWRSAGQDLRMSWNAGAAAAAAPGPQPAQPPAPQPAVADSPYAQFAQPQAGAPPATAAPPPVAAAPPQPSLPTANPFINANPPPGPPPATVAQQPSAQQPTAQQPSPQLQISPPPAAPPVTSEGAPPQTELPPAVQPSPAPGTSVSPAPMNQTAGNRIVGNPPPSLTPEQGLVPASQAPPVALEGYCPVTLLEQRKWKRSDARFGAIHRGRTYLFASENEQKKFLADPDAFSPMLSGYDPVVFSQRGEMVEGRRSYGLTYNKQIFLFADEASLQTFSKTPDAFAQSARQAMIRAEYGSKLR